MNKSSPDEPDSKKHQREKTTIDHFVNEVFEPDAQEKHQQPATTDTGASVEDQVRKGWDPKKGGGLPVF